MRGKRCLLTGAAGGIGAATASRICAAGGRVVLGDRDEAEISRLAGELREAGGDAHALAFDVSDDDAVRAAIETGVELIGGLDALITNAGILTTGEIEEVRPESFRRTLEVNLVGTFLCIRHAVPHLRKCGAGAIVCMASQAGIEGVPGASSYAASKFGVVGLAQSLARELAADGIRVNAVAPGLVDTPMLAGYFQQKAQMRGAAVEEMVAEALEEVPIGRLATAEEVADVIVFLASDLAAYVSGATMPILGGKPSG
jgi:meso-butanediol dehydrogenase / (S,S)-butanediol dehydrogenase / diacetyl reductase